MIDKHNESAIYNACMNNNSEMCKLLMENGGNPNLGVSSQSKSTCLSIAAQRGNKQIVQLLFNLNKKFKHSFDWVCYVTYVIHYIFCIHFEQYTLKLYNLLAIAIYILYVYTVILILIG